jgi:hypothetical protein
MTTKKIRSFSLASKKYNVKYVCHDTTDLGRSLYPLLTIEVQEMWNGTKIPEESQLQTLFHEVTHCILSEIGQHVLSGDESFVQSFSLLLHQFIETMRLS